MEEKKSHIKNLFSQTVIYGFGLFINRFISLLLIPLYTYYFLPEELGIFNVINSIWLIAGIFFVYGMDTSFIKFFATDKSLEEKQITYSTTMILLTCTSIVFSLIIYYFSNDINILLKLNTGTNSILLLKLMCLVLLVDTIYRFPLLLLRAELQAKKYFLANLISVIINIVANFILIIFLRQGVEAIFYSYIISCIITLIVTLLLTKKYLRLRFSFEKAKNLITFGNKFIYIGLFILFIDVSDRFFIKYLLNDSEVGIYSANYKLAAGMSLIIAGFRFAWTPYFLNLTEHPDNKNILSRVFTYYVFSGLTLLFIFISFLPPIVKFKVGNFSILNENYWEGLKILPYILSAYFFSGIFSNLYAAPFFSEKTYIILVVTFIGFIVNFIFNILLIQKFGIIGAAQSTLIAYFVMSIFLYVLSQKVYKINYQWNKVIQIVIIFTFGFLTSFFMKKYFLHSDIGVSFFADIILLTIIITILHKSKIFELTKFGEIFKLKPK
ncbi:MAG: oligosaccharide flippase family protein [Ignavibacteria bacterium]|nr:oligosaccharide flippase family protein [Ignavibacteria bacterium]